MVKRRAIAKPQIFRPINFGSIILTATGMEVSGRPSLTEYEAAGMFIQRTHAASGFWLGDWLRYGDSRDDWRERLSQIQDIGISEKTAKNVRAIAGIDPSRRRDDVDFSAHDAVAGMAGPDQEHWLERAHMEGWTVRELRLEIRASKRRKVLEGQAVLQGMYRVIYADPPWAYNDRGDIHPENVSTAYKRAEAHYPTLTIADICALPVPAHSMPNAVLFLWVTAPLLLQNPGPREVIEAWGFTPKTGMVWDKVLGNFGHYVHACHEHLIIATRGSGLPDRPTPQPDSVQTIRRSDTHSEKPAEFRTIIEKLYDGPYLELFARERVEGWSCFGNDAGLWASEAEAQS